MVRRVTEEDMKEALDEYLQDCPFTKEGILNALDGKWH